MEGTLDNSLLLDTQLIFTAGSSYAFLRRALISIVESL